MKNEYASCCFYLFILILQLFELYTSSHDDDYKGVRDQKCTEPLGN